EAGFVVGDLTFPVGRMPPAAVGRPAYYGIRPEHFHLSDQGIPVEVSVIEPTGSETQVFARVQGRDMTCVFRERISAQPGETIRIQPDPALVHLFDNETGRRLN
ncbi:TOBE domain-containing protein, partial [Microvirga puerhi]